MPRCFTFRTPALAASEPPLSRTRSTRVSHSVTSAAVFAGIVTSRANRWPSQFHADVNVPYGVSSDALALVRPAPRRGAMRERRKPGAAGSRPIPPMV